MNITSDHEHTMTDQIDSSFTEGLTSELEANEANADLQTCTSADSALQNSDNGQSQNSIIKNDKNACPNDTNSPNTANKIFKYNKTCKACRFKKMLTILRIIPKLKLKLDNYKYKTIGTHTLKINYIECDLELPQLYNKNFVFFQMLMDKFRKSYGTGTHQRVTNSQNHNQNQVHDENVSPPIQVTNRGTKRSLPFANPENTNNLPIRQQNNLKRQALPNLNNTPFLTDSRKNLQCVDFSEGLRMKSAQEAVFEKNHQNHKKYQNQIYQPLQDDRMSNNRNLGNGTSSSNSRSHYQVHHRTSPRASSILSNFDIKIKKLYKIFKNTELEYDHAKSSHLCLEKAIDLIPSFNDTANNFIKSKFSYLEINWRYIDSLANSSLANLNLMNGNEGFSSSTGSNSQIPSELLNPFDNNNLNIDVGILPNSGFLDAVIFSALETIVDGESVVDPYKLQEARETPTSELTQNWASLSLKTVTHLCKSLKTNYQLSELLRNYFRLIFYNNIRLDILSHFNFKKNKFYFNSGKYCFNSEIIKSQLNLRYNDLGDSYFMLLMKFTKICSDWPSDVILLVRFYCMLGCCEEFRKCEEERFKKQNEAEAGDAATAATAPESQDNLAHFFIKKTLDKLLLMRPYIHLMIQQIGIEKDVADLLVFLGLADDINLFCISKTILIQLMR